LARYANSKYWVDFDDFSFYRMQVVDVYYVGGFGVMGWLENAVAADLLKLIAAHKFHKTMYQKLQNGINDERAINHSSVRKN
jgi:hypothetical protein